MTEEMSTSRWVEHERRKGHGKLCKCLFRRDRSVLCSLLFTICVPSVAFRDRDDRSRRLEERYTLALST
jgi:hypothetical protein